MNLYDYLNFALTTAVYPKEASGRNWIYPLIGLNGEVGELSNKLKKVIRDDNSIITNEKRNQLLDEMGDIFWYLVILCHELKIDPDHVLELNIIKLRKRQESNTVHDRNRK